MEIRITNKEWEFVSKYLSPLPRRATMRGRPRAPDKEVFEAILWVVVGGARWMDLDVRHYPAKSTCHKRFQGWCMDGSWARLQHALTGKLHKNGVIRPDEGFIDGSFIKAKKGVELRRIAADWEGKKAQF